MTLSAGTRLGVYEIVAPLSAGGMGEVYRARDTRLSREVAIKVLPSATASDPDRRLRFEQEARSASALNHPNILTIHDVGSSDGTVYIAMELIEGKTLRELISGGEPLPIEADSASAEDIRAAVNQVVKEWGEIDIFVNNAGIMIRGTVDSYSLEDFDRMLAVNVRAAFVGIQAASQAMTDGGRIILIGSNTAVRTAFPGASVYSMTKAALTGLVRGAAIDLAPRTITVNNIQPGPTATDMSAPHAEAVKTLIPLARMADVSEIAGFVSYLASDEAGFITGASLTIDGGYIA